MSCCRKFYSWVLLLSPSLVPADVTGASIQEFLPGKSTCQRNCEVTEWAAHRAAAQIYLPLSLVEHREYAWHVYELSDGTFGFSHPEIGKTNSRVARTPPKFGPGSPLSTGHTHWDNELMFSGLDREWVRNNRRTLYLFTGNDEVRMLDFLSVSMLSRKGRGAGSRPDLRYAGRLVKRAGANPVRIPEEAVVR